MNYFFHQRQHRHAREVLRHCTVPNNSFKFCDVPRRQVLTWLPVSVDRLVAQHVRHMRSLHFEKLGQRSLRHTAHCPVFPSEADGITERCASGHDISRKKP
jgi:hypothetical protein